VSANGLYREYLLRLDPSIDEALDVLVNVVRSNEIQDSLTDCFLRRVPEDLRRAGVHARDPGVVIDHDDGIWHSSEELAEVCLVLLELVAQTGERLEVRLQDISKMCEQLLVEIAVLIGLVIENADGPEHPAVGPQDGESQVRDHPYPDLGSRLPLIVLEGVGNEQRLILLDHRLAKSPDIHREELFDGEWIATRVAGRNGPVISVVRRFEFSSPPRTERR
jgi:hypothetical protein